MQYSTCILFKNLYYFVHVDDCRLIKVSVKQLNARSSFQYKDNSAVNRLLSDKNSLRMSYNLDDFL